MNCEFIGGPMDGEILELEDDVLQIKFEFEDSKRKYIYMYDYVNISKKTRFFKVEKIESFNNAK